MVYDALGRVLEDAQSYDGRSRYVTNTSFESHPAVELTYPDGRQTVSSHDALYRRTDVEESGGAPIASWQFYGPARVAEVQLGNGLIQSHMNDARDRSAVQEGQPTPGWGDDASDRLGYDGVGRMIAKRYLGGGIDATSGAYNSTAAVVGFTTEYDPASNKLYERHLHAEERSHLYEPMVAGTPQGGYDSLDRLRQVQRGQLDTGGGSVVSPITLPGADEERTYGLDHLGNWKQTAHTPVGGSLATEHRTHNKLNQTTQRDDGAVINLSYDLSGNLTDDGERLYVWDALSRLMEVKRSADDAVVGQYRYDASGRRVHKTVSNGGLSGNIANGASDYLYSGWQCVEERDSSDSPTKQYVWGTYIDELIQQRDDPGGTPADYYAAQNPNYNVFALLDNSASIAEAYDYTPYGERLVFTAPGSGGDWWAGNATQAEQGLGVFGHQGLLHDEVTELIWNRDRILHPRLGRFNQPDRFEYIDGMNRYEYVRSNPVNHLDPLGLASVRPTLSGIQEAIDAGLYDLARDLLRQYHNEGRTAFRNYVRLLSIGADTVDTVLSHFSFDLGAVEPYNEDSRCCKDGKTYKAEVRGTEVRLGFKVGVSVKKEWAQFSSEGDSLPPCPEEGAYVEALLAPAAEAKAAAAGAKVQITGGVRVGPGGVKAFGETEGELSVLNIGVAGSTRYDNGVDAAAKIAQESGIKFGAKIGAVRWYSITLKEE